MNPATAPTGSAAVDRQQIHAELRQRRETFHAIVDTATAGELRQPSNGTRWNNEELLFHMLFGYIVVVVLIRMIKALGLLPHPATKPFAALLNAFTRPFNTINYWGSRFGAKLYNHRRLGAKLDRVTAALETTLDRTSEASLRRGMHYPTRWDPFFKNYMTLADVFHYPTQHFDFHQRQLTLG
ncbi:MAG: DinB family protein [Acidimicrobiia bacterium]